MEFAFSSDRYGSTAPACSIRFFLSHHGSFLGYTVGALILASSRYTVKHLNTHTHGHEGVSPFIYLFYSTDRAHTVHAIHTFFLSKDHAIHTTPLLQQHSGTGDAPTGPTWQGGLTPFPHASINPFPMCRPFRRPTNLSIPSSAGFLLVLGESLRGRAQGPFSSQNFFGAD